MPIARRWVAACTLLLSILGCSHVDVAAERDAILATDKPWQEAIAAKDVDRAVSFWSDDAVVLAPGQASLVPPDVMTGTTVISLPGRAPQVGPWRIDSVVCKNTISAVPPHSISP